MKKVVVFWICYFIFMVLFSGKLVEYDINLFNKWFDKNVDLPFVFDVIIGMFIFPILIPLSIVLFLISLFI